MAFFGKVSCALLPLGITVTAGCGMAPDGADHADLRRHESASADANAADEAGAGFVSAQVVESLMLDSSSTYNLVVLKNGVAVAGGVIDGALTVTVGAGSG